MSHIAYRLCLPVIIASASCVPLPDPIAAVTEKPSDLLMISGDGQPPSIKTKQHDGPNDQDGMDCNSDGLPDPLSAFAIDFDGVDDYVNAGSGAELVMTNSLTIEAWIHPTGPGSHEVAGGIIINKEGEYEIARFADGTIRYALANGDPNWIWTSTDYVVPFNIWAHVALTYDFGEIHVYVNGELVHTYDGSGAIGDAHPLFNDFRIGARRESQPQHFDGLIDEARAWNVARTQQEIQDSMNVPLAGDEPGLVGYWRFEEGSGLVTQDTAGENDAGLTNGPTWVALYEDCNSNAVPDECETSSDCNGNALPDECESPFPDCNTNGLLDYCEDCNGNGRADSCDLTVGTSSDCDANGSPDECDGDCNGNGAPDGCDVAVGTSTDCNGNGVPDECEGDCNTNGTLDVCESGLDCNSNGVPDECESDCNSNGVPDFCDSGGEADCNTNGVSDLCEPDMDCNTNDVRDLCESYSDCDYNDILDICEAWTDCNTNDILDVCEGLSDCDQDGEYDVCEPDSDCDTDGVPDPCELGGDADCNSNGVPDHCDAMGATAYDCDEDGVIDACEDQPDCNSNGIPDDCDVLIGTAPDCNTDGVLDACETFSDCDGNGVPDPCDPDCNTNQLPDACELDGQSDCDGDGILDACNLGADCNTNGTPDFCDLPSVADCNTNEVPDDCEGPDCDTNQVLDVCDLAGGTAQDCNSNGMPDSCDGDCNTNGLVDACETTAGSAADCDTDQTPDECEVAAGDMDMSGQVDGDDIRGFVDCLLGDTADAPCLLADLNADGSVDVDDASLFVSALLDKDGEGPGPFFPCIFIPRCLTALDILCSNNTVERDRNAGAFVEKNPQALTLLMRPLRVVTFLPGGSAQITVNPANVIRIYDTNGNLQNLPLTINPAPLVTNLRISGENFGAATLRIVYTEPGGQRCEDTVYVRVGCFPGLAGEDLRTATPPPASDYPYFNFVRTFNTGGNLRVAIDPVRHRERVGHSYRIYVVHHKTAQEWTPSQADPDRNVLVDRTGRPAGQVTTAVPVVAGGIQDNIREVPMPADTTRTYDVVFDFCDQNGDLTPNGRLDRGDIMGMLTTDPNVAEVAVLRDPGAAPAPAPATASRTYTGPTFTIRTKQMIFDGLTEDKQIQLGGQLFYPDPIPANAPFVVIAHGNHYPRRRELAGVPTDVDADLTSAENFLGHTYLQEFLAQHGYVSLSVSLDASFDETQDKDTRRGFGEIRVRAWTILKNMEAVLRAAPPAAVIPAALRPQFARVARNNIHFIGHSRGGEAVIQAFRLLTDVNARPRDNDNQPETLADSTTWNVRSVCSIAPVSFRLPQDFPANLPPFLLLFGTADGDVNGLGHTVRPYTHYDLASGEKAALTIIGANHNFFNSSWPQSDADQSNSWLYAPDSVHDATQENPPHGNVIRTALTRADFTTPEDVGASLRARPEQVAIARAYCHAFLQVHARQRDAYRDYFARPANRFRPPSVAAAIPIHSMYRPAPASVLVVVDNFETATPNTANSSSGGTVAHANLAYINEFPLTGPAQDGQRGADGANRARNRFTQETRGVVIEWTVAGARYDQTLRANALERDFTRYRFISFRVAQQALADQTVALAGPMRLRVTLIDAAGNRSTMETRALSDIPAIYAARQTNRQVWRRLDPPPPPRRLRVVDVVLDANTSTESAFKTFRIDPCLFLTNGGNPHSIDLTRIATIRIELAPSARGRIGFDDLELTNR